MHVLNMAYFLSGSRSSCTKLISELFPWLLLYLYLSKSFHFTLYCDMPIVYVVFPPYILECLSEFFSLVDSPFRWLPFVLCITAWFIHFEFVVRFLEEQWHLSCALTSLSRVYQLTKPSVKSTVALRIMSSKSHMCQCFAKIFLAASCSWESDRIFSSVQLARHRWQR